MLCSWASGWGAGLTGPPGSPKPCYLTAAPHRGACLVPTADGMSAVVKTPQHMTGFYPDASLFRCGTKKRYGGGGKRKRQGNKLTVSSSNSSPCSELLFCLGNPYWNASWWICQCQPTSESPQSSSHNGPNQLTYVPATSAHSFWVPGFMPKTC